MFLIDPPAAATALRVDLAPRQLFGGAGGLIRAALAARPPGAGPAASAAGQPRSQLGPGLAKPARQRRAG
jgi:hypothetical protein